MSPTFARTDAIQAVDQTAAAVLQRLTKTDTGAAHRQRHAMIPAAASSGYVLFSGA